MGNSFNLALFVCCMDFTYGLFPCFRDVYICGICGAMCQLIGIDRLTRFYLKFKNNNQLLLIMWMNLL